MPLLFPKQRTLILAGALLLLIIFGLSLFVRPEKQTTEKTTKQTTSYDATTSRVFIKDFYTYGDYFTPQKQEAVETALYTYARASQKNNTPDLYTGVVRKNSFLQTKNSNNSVATSFLVDVLPIGVTYILKVNGTVKDGSQPVLIQCAPTDQQLTTKLECADGMKNRE